MHAHRCVVVLFALLFPVLAHPAAPVRRPVAAWRVVFNDDTQNQFGGKTTAELLRRRVDFIAENGVDALAMCVCEPDLTYFPSDAGEWIGSLDRITQPTSGQRWNVAHNLRTLEESGKNPIAVIADQCRRRGIAILAGVRMNDSHHIRGGYVHAGLASRFFLEHQEWTIRDDRDRLVGNMDYAVPEVREHRLAILREVVNRFEVDGLELNFMRHPRLFQPGTEQQNAPIMIRFVAEIRRLLDAARGPDSLLGARLPGTLAKCVAAGIDVGALVREARLDYLCPMENMPDANLPVEEFVALTAGTDCRVFVGVHPNLPGHRDRATLMTIERFRGLTHNYFAYGAQGVSPFNFMLCQIGTWHQQRHAGSWQMIREVHDPAALITRARAYPYDHTVAPDRVISIDRNRDEGRRQVLRFRIAEDFSDSSWRRVLTVVPHDLSTHDRVAFDINGDEVTDRVGNDFLFDMCDPPGTARLELDLADTAVRRGDNELGVTLVRANPHIRSWNAEYLGYPRTIAIKPIRFDALEIIVSRSGTLLE